MKESVEMFKEAERIGAVKIMIPTSELKFMLQQVSKVEEIQKVIELFPVYCRLDEDIPDDDKEAAYKMGYADAIADIAESIKSLKGESQ